MSAESTSRDNAEMRRRVRDMFAQVLSRCSVSKAMPKHLQLEGSMLRVGKHMYDLEAFSQRLVISIGKAGHTMAESLVELVGGGVSGIVSCPAPPPVGCLGFRYFIGGHPLPNRDSVRGAESILQLLATTSPSSLVIFLISGGASAIAEKPISDSITLPDLVATYQALVRSGAPIAEINAVRKHLSAIKGGRLAVAAGNAQQLSILISDVPENALDALASGPTMPDSTTATNCYSVARRYGLARHLPDSVRVLFDKQKLKETPKPGDPAFDRSQFMTILSNATAQTAAVEQAVMTGFAAEVDNTCDDWEYGDAADHLLSRLRQLRKGASRVCLISGGELTVKVSGQAGTGGRNQQFALYCATKIADENITILSAGTDGIDGNSMAAGAVADGSTVARAKEKGVDPSRALKRFDAFPLFEALGDAVITGPTGNNVRDLRMLLAW